MLRLVRFRPPVLRFRRGTALTPVEGLRMGLKPFAGPGRLALCLLAPRDVSRYALETLENLVYGVKGFAGLNELFDVDVEWPPTEFVVEKPLDMHGAAEEVEEVDVAVAAVPDEMAVPYEEDPYMPLKQVFAAKGVPSQMLTYATARRLRFKSYVLYNLALSIYAKAGGVPWLVDERFSGEVIIGLDSGGGGSAAMVIRNSKPYALTWRVEYNPHIETIKCMRTLLEEVLLEFVKEPPLRSLIVHRDGVVFREEAEAMRDVAVWAVEEGLLAPESYWALVSVRKRVTPRLLRRKAGRLSTAEPGTCVLLDYHSAIVATSQGPPMLPWPVYVRPLVIELVEASSWDVGVEPIARDVYWLSELHWASAFASARLPITTLYAHRICSFWRAGVTPSEALYGSLWFL